MEFINTYMAIIIPGFANIFGIFLIRQYCISIPDSLIEAAEWMAQQIFRFIEK